MSPFLGTRGAGTNKAFGFAGAAAPNQVTGLTATDFGTSRAFNNGRIDLSWTAPGSNGATISGYLIQRSTDNITFSTLVASTGTSATTYSDTSLTSSQIYYYKVSAINTVGTGDASTAASATATTVPQAPTIGSAASSSSTTATVTYTAGATGGKAATYTATSTPGSLTGTGSSPITVSGLTTGTSYTFTVAATNANGTSTSSSASNSVTPELPGAFLQIATATGTGSSGVITFNSIPQTYKHLVLRISSFATSNDGSIALRWNGDNSNDYNTISMYFGNNSNNIGDSASNWFVPSTAGIATNQLQFPYNAEISIPGYSNATRNKSIRGYGNMTNVNASGTGSEFEVFVGTEWDTGKNIAVTSLSIHTTAVTNWSTDAKFSLYGLN